MKCMLGMVGDGFALVVTDTSSVHSILTRARTRSPSSAWGEASGESGRRAATSVYVFKSFSALQIFNAGRHRFLKSTGRIPAVAGGASTGSGGDAGVNGRVISDSGAGASATALEAAKSNLVISRTVKDFQLPGAGRGVPDAAKHNAIIIRELNTH
ncbi:hypothetical protein POTOM_021851 [Populus tomentosa]|uniref:Uncharacterized protein n=1 Tax=Populus tomentosa TaxID=118781 RepID=A0A8X7ZY64_POPTO|nr:hypothetical protein POTOM_021851 [Populus tomentosa]